jgi:membrane associated rhomboid family serine protease
MSHPKRLILLGFLLSLFGFVAPFLIVLGVLESTFALNFISYGASVAGLFTGMLGAAMYTRVRRKQDN